MPTRRCCQVQRGETPARKKFDDLGADVDARGSGSSGNGWTALFAAAKHGHADAVRALVSRGADVDARATRGGATPLFYAASHNHVELIWLLASLGANLDARRKNGATAISYAALQGHADAVTLLESLGADVDSADDAGFRPIHYACKNKRRSRSSSSSSSSGGGDGRGGGGGGGGGGESEYGCAADMVAHLHSLGADVISSTAGSQHGWTPMHYAARLGNNEVVLKLASLGADPATTDSSGLRPLFYAELKKHAATCELLRSLGGADE